MSVGLKGVDDLIETYYLVRYVSVPTKRGVHLIEVILIIFYKRNDWDLSY